MPWPRAIGNKTFKSFFLPSSRKLATSLLVRFRLVFRIILVIGITILDIGIVILVIGIVILVIGITILVIGIKYY